MKIFQIKICAYKGPGDSKKKFELLFFVIQKFVVGLSIHSPKKMFHKLPWIEIS